jgi:hypothetical protein
MIKEIDGAFENKNSELLEGVFLPAKEKANIKDSKAFQILNENKKDVSELFTGKKNEMFTPITIKKFEEKDKESAAEFHLNTIKEIGNNLFDFVDQSVVGDTVDYAASGFDKEKIPPTFGILANNIGEFGVNLLPVMDKLIDFMGKPPGPDGKIPDMLNNDEKLMEWSGEKVKYFKDNRAKFKAIQDDANMASQFANLVVQDTLVSLPIYEGLTKAGVPKAWATVLGFGMGSAIALEEKLFGMESTFIQEYGKEEVNGLKKILNILPNTPFDAIADEVIQTFEYTAFAFLIPPIIQAAKFMKTNLPSFAVGGAVAGAIEGQDPNTEEPTQEFNLGIDQGKKKSEINLDDQSAIPGTVNQYGFEKTASLKALVNAVIPKKTPVFNSAVKQAVENIAEKGTGDQILGSIKNVPGVKANEIKWIGLDTFLEGKKSVTKKEVVDFVNQNNIDIEEVSQGGKASKLSDDLEEKINTFENRYLDSNEDPTYPNYDVFYYKQSLASNKEVDRVKKNYNMAYSQLDDMLEGLPINSETFLKDFTTPSGQIEVHTFTDNLNNRPVYVGRDLAETLINEKETVRDIPAALNSPGSDRYTRRRVMEFEPLELEKFVIERERRIFMANNNSPKFERFTEPGGEDYTELVFKIKKGGMDVGIPSTRYDNEISYTPYKNPSHMDVKSEIAHVRFKSRMKGNMKLLAVEEMQSDFGIKAAKIKKEDIANIEELSGSQLGRRSEEVFGKNKFTVEEATEKLKGRIKPYDFPFKNNWYELTIKRLIRYAADNGFDGIAIPKGDLAANRYGESIKKAQKIGLQIVDGPKKGSYFFDLNYMNEAGNIIERGPSFNQSNYEEMKKIIGEKEFQNIKFQIEKLINDKEEIGEFMLKDFNIPYKKDIILGSGAGKYRLYNESIPSFLKKYSKKWNAKVYDDNIKASGEEFTDEAIIPNEVISKNMPVTIIEITPSMKKSVQEEGQSLFEILGIGGAGAVGAKAVSDSQGNNTISNLTQ